MKKTTRIFKSIISIAAVITFAACNKDVEQPSNDLTIHTTGKISSERQGNGDVAARAIPKTSTGYTGTSTLGDTTNAVSHH